MRYVEPCQWENASPLWSFCDESSSNVKYHKWHLHAFFSCIIYGVDGETSTCLSPFIPSIIHQTFFLWILWILLPLLSMQINFTLLFNNLILLIIHSHKILYWVSFCCSYFYRFIYCRSHSNDCCRTCSRNFHKVYLETIREWRHVKTNPLCQKYFIQKTLLYGGATKL